MTGLLITLVVLQSFSLLSLLSISGNIAAAKSAVEAWATATSREANSLWDNLLGKGAN